MMLVSGNEKQERQQGLRRCDAWMLQSVLMGHLCEQVALDCDRWAHMGAFLTCLQRALLCGDIRG